jgi:hypothetical protein
VLFAVEVRNPEKRNNQHGKLFKAETVAGQTLDYLKGLKQQGIDQFCSSLYVQRVCHCSFSHELATNEDTEVYGSLLRQGAANAKNPPENRFKMEKESSKTPSSNPAKAQHLYMKLGSLESNKRKAATNTNSEGAKTMFLGTATTSTTTMAPAVSTAGTAASIPNTNSDDDRGGAKTMFVETATTSTMTMAATVSTAGTAASTAAANIPYDYKGRNVVYSQKFGVEMLYKVLTLLLESSLVAVAASKESIVALVPQEGDHVRKEYCTLTESGYHWEILDATVTYNEVPKFDCAC